MAVSETKNEIESDFFNGKISHIVSFDHLKFDFNEENKKLLKNTIIKNVSISSVEPVDLNIDFYSEDFVAKYPQIWKVVLKMDIKYIDVCKKELEEFREKLENHGKKLEALKQFKLNLCELNLEHCNKKSLSQEVQIEFCFDEIGISSVRFDFEIINSVKTSNLIDLTNDTGNLVDEVIFKKLKDDLIQSLPKINNNVTLYKSYDTYPIIISTDTNIDIKNNKYEIAGISTLNSLFASFDKETIAMKIKNKFSYYENTLILVGHSATLMLFQNPEITSDTLENYIEERINAIELYRRQKVLLNKIDFSLDNLIEELGKKNSQKTDIKTLKEKMGKVKDTQLDIESKLEIYRNTRTSITASLIMFFDILNETFRLDNHYKFVREKLNTCDNVYQGLYNQLRNELMESIQFIVVILGILSLILVIIDMVLGENGEVKLIVILIFILIILTFKTNIKGIYDRLLKELLKSFA